MNKMKKLIVLLAIVLSCVACQMNSTNSNKQMKVTYHQIKAGNCTIFYREAGDPQKPTILLLHGFPSASHMFRDLIPLLAEDYHLIAPDMPSFGQTVSPLRSEQEYTFDYLARTMEAFTEALHMEHYAMYIFDYGAPVGLRLAM